MTITASSVKRLDTKLHPYQTQLNTMFNTDLDALISWVNTILALSGVLRVSTGVVYGSSNLNHVASPISSYDFNSQDLSNIDDCTSNKIYTKYAEIENTAVSSDSKILLKNNYNSHNVSGHVLLQDSTSTNQSLDLMTVSNHPVRIGVNNGASYQLKLGTSGVLEPYSDNTHDLGSLNYSFKDAWIQGTINPSNTTRLGGNVKIGESFDADVGLEFGKSTHTGKVSYMDWHYGIGSDVDYIFRTICDADNTLRYTNRNGDNWRFDTNGFATSGSSGVGSGKAFLGETKLWGDLLFSANNTWDIGTNLIAPSDIYAVNGCTTTSDESLKENIEICDLGLDFIKKLYENEALIKFRLKDTIIPEFKQTQNIKSSRMVEKKKLRIKTQKKDVIEEYLDYNPDTFKYELKSRIYSYNEPIPSHKEYVFNQETFERMEFEVFDYEVYSEFEKEFYDDVIEYFQPSQIISHNRTHYKLSADKVLKTLQEFGIDTKYFAGYVADKNKETGEYDGKKSLRLDEFIAPVMRSIVDIEVKYTSEINNLLSIIDNLKDRLEALENK